MRKILAFALVSLLLWSCDRSDPDKRASIRIDGQTEYNLSDKADAISINVVCNSSWSYDLGGADWLKESKRGDSFLLLTLAENKTTEERTATVKFQAPASGTARAEATVTVKQAGKEVPVTLELSDYGPITVPAISTVPVSITVKSSCEQWEYDIEGAPAWIKAGKSDGALSLEIAENKVDEDRKATISFYAPTKQAAKAECHVSLKQEAAATPDTPEDLSVSGTANSYLIGHSGYYCFDATVRGNGKAVEGLSEPAGITAEGASLVWQSQPGMISKVTYKDGKISFRVSDKTGNAVIAAVDADGNIAWSWHIWYPKAAPKGLGSSTGAVVMEYNLGALSADHTSLDSYGLLYQWGRKDPFPGSPVMNGGNITMKNVSVYGIDGEEVEITHVDALGSEISGSHLAYSVAHPTVCIGNRLQYVDGCRDWLPASEGNASLWGNPEGNKRQESEYPNVGSKSYYDPCPVGWRVPPIATFRPFTKTGGMAWATGTTDDFSWGDLGGATTTAVVDFNGDGLYSLDDWTDGWHIYLDKENGVHTYFPATTRYDGQYAMFMGSMVGIWGNYWTNSTDGSTGGLAQAFSFGLKDYNNPNYSITISPLSSGSRADAYAVRCIKE